MWARALSGAERQPQFPPGVLVERLKVDCAVALVAEQLDQGRTPLFLGRLHLSVRHTEKLHLQRLDEEILGIPAIRARERQKKSPFRA
jgi:hypothetical protein